MKQKTQCPKCNFKEMYQLGKDKEKCFVCGFERRLKKATEWRRT